MRSTYFFLFALLFSLVVHITGLPAGRPTKSKKLRESIKRKHTTGIARHKVSNLHVSVTRAKKVRKSPSSFVKAAELRKDTARKIAIAEHRDTHGNDNYDPTGQEADHLLELQQVTSWLNKNRNKPKAACKQALKKVLNSKSNLAMTSAENNSAKKIRVASWLSGKGGPALPHDQYVTQHRSKILQVAQEVDAALAGVCGFKTVGNPIEQQTKEIYSFH